MSSTRTIPPQFRQSRSTPGSPGVDALSVSGDVSGRAKVSFRGGDIGVEGERLEALCAPAVEGNRAASGCFPPGGEMILSLHFWIPTTSLPMEPTLMRGRGSVFAPSSTGLLLRRCPPGGRRPPRLRSRERMSGPNDVPLSKGETVSWAPPAARAESAGFRWLSGVSSGMVCVSCILSSTRWNSPAAAVCDRAMPSRPPTTRDLRRITRRVPYRKPWFAPPAASSA